MKELFIAELLLRMLDIEQQLSLNSKIVKSRKHLANC